VRNKVVALDVPKQPQSATGADRIGNPYGRLFESQGKLQGGRMSRLSEFKTPKIVLIAILLGSSYASAQGPTPTVTVVPDPNATVLAAPPAAPTQETLRTKPLSLPNTSVVGVGTNQIPADLTQGRLPAAIQLPYGPDREGGWSYSAKGWIPPVYCHQPTYYEDTMLENHGHERHPHLQPMLSGTRFYTGLFFTPYLYCLHGPLEDLSSAGRYRPGTAAPGLRQRAPYDPYAIGTQAVSTGAGISLLRP
jgi:hypothetical protein